MLRKRNKIILTIIILGAFGAFVSGQVAEIKKAIPANYEPLSYEKYHYKSGVEIWVHCYNFSGAVLPDFEYILLLFEKIDGKWELTANYPWGATFEKTGIKFKRFPDGTYPEPGKIKNSIVLMCQNSVCPWQQIYVRFIRDKDGSIIYQELTPYYLDYPCRGCDE